MKNNFEAAIESALTDEFAWLDGLKNPYSNYEFSPQFEKNMKKILPKAACEYVSLGKRRVRKIFVVVLAAILAIAITGCAFVVHYLVEWNETENGEQRTLDVTFDSRDNTGENEITTAMPKTPKGYKITDQYCDDYSCTINYSHSDGTQISFTKCNDLENMSVSIDNEDSDLKEIAINVYKGYIYKKDNINIIYWTDSTCFYVLQGTCDTDVLIKMAVSVGLTAHE